jgi:hypothetical protein
MWEMTVQPGRTQTTIWRMRISLWIPKSTDTHSDYVIHIGFPLQQWLNESFSVLCYTYIAPLVNVKLFIRTAK